MLPVEGVQINVFQKFIRSFYKASRTIHLRSINAAAEEYLIQKKNFKIDGEFGICIVLIKMNRHQAGGGGGPCAPATDWYNDCPLISVTCTFSMHFQWLKWNYTRNQRHTNEHEPSFLPNTMTISSISGSNLTGNWEQIHLSLGGNHTLHAIYLMSSQCSPFELFYWIPLVHC